MWKKILTVAIYVMPCSSYAACHHYSVWNYNYPQPPCNVSKVSLFIPKSIKSDPPLPPVIPKKDPIEILKIELDVIESTKLIPNIPVDELIKLIALERLKLSMH